MKKIIISIVLLFLFIISSTNSYSYPLVGGFLRFIDVSENTDFIAIYTNPCINSGNKCTIIHSVLVLCPYSFLPVQGGKLIDIQINPITDDCQPNPVLGSNYINYPSTQNYTFPIGATMRIEEFNGYPNLVGLILNIGGLTTDNNSHIQYFLPF